MNVVLVMLFSNSAMAQRDFQRELRREIVKIQSDRFSIQEYQLVTIDGNRLQVAIKSTSPTSVVSRDMFVSIHATTSTMFILLMLDAAGIYLDEVTIKEIDELIGDPDITLNIVMARNGMQIQVITAEGRENITMTWADIFGE